jgi:hypothetical protein
MTLDDFFTTYSGKGIDFDGSFGFQCVDLIQQYTADVLAIAPWGSGNAVGRWTSYPQQHFTRIPRTLLSAPKPGDIVVWGSGIGPYGHIAVARSGNALGFESFDQNFPVGSLCHFQKHSYKHVLGWLRPVGTVTGDDMSQADKDRLSYLEGVLMGIKKSPVYLTPDGAGHMLVTFQGEDQVRTFLNMEPTAPIAYNPVPSVEIGKITPVDTEGLITVITNAIRNFFRK